MGGAWQRKCPRANQFAFVLRVFLLLLGVSAGICESPRNRAAPWNPRRRSRDLVRWVLAAGGIIGFKQRLRVNLGKSRHETERNRMDFLDEGYAEILADSETDDWLQRTSRTFALAIPLLPPRLRRYVGIAYLLFRIADTIEDGDFGNRENKMSLFRGLQQLLGQEAPSKTDFQPFEAQVRMTLAGSVTDDVRLVLDAPRVISTVFTFDAAVQQTILQHLQRSVDGMERFIAAGSAQGSVRIGSLSELKDYCYCVAGIVGEMLTELFLLEEPQLKRVGPELRKLAPLFGEGLQLVNVVKDAKLDDGDGRVFLPPEVSDASVIELARRDLGDAEQFVTLLCTAGASDGVWQFCRLPVVLALRTLQQVERHGAGAKIPRTDVLKILLEVVRKPPRSDAMVNSTNL